MIDPETWKIIIANFPNYLGLLLLYRQQSRLIDKLLVLIEHLTNDESVKNQR